MASPSSSKRKREIEENALPEMRRRKRKRKENALSGMAPPPPSSNPASDDPSFHRYDVFIMCGSDAVKAIVASGLKVILECSGLKVFLHCTESQPGEILSAEVEHVIHSSSVYIVIFCRRYAKSPLCLDVLQLMQKAGEKTGAKSVPLFYEVKPSELRYVEKGVYCKTFLRYEKKGKYIDKLEQWKKALIDAPSSIGVTFDGNLGNLYKKIVEIVVDEAREGRKRFKLEVADCPVGLEEGIQKLEVKISTIGQSNNGNGKIVAIVGRPGVGKTTLAKEFYNHKHPMFYRSSILLGVGGAHRSNKMSKMQQKLMDDLSMSLPLSSANFPPSSPREGFRVEIKSQLEQWYSKPFIIIDGVDHADQLEVLAVKEFLNHGALVIVTCCDKTVLQSFEMVEIYKMKRLDRMHAKQLFCSHAFGKTHPPKGREKLVERILDVSDGLPWKLKQLGQELYSII